jgi:hypothetical protein
MIIEIALGIVLGVILLYLLPFAFALLAIVIPIILIIGVVVFGISIIPDEWIHYVGSNYQGIILYGFIFFSLCVIIIESKIFKRAKESKIINQLAKQSLKFNMESFGEKFFKFSFWLFVFWFVLLMIAVPLSSKHKENTPAKKSDEPSWTRTPAQPESEDEKRIREMEWYEKFGASISNNESTGNGKKLENN